MAPGVEWSLGSEVLATLTGVGFLALLIGMALYAKSEKREIAALALLRNDFVGQLRGRHRQDVEDIDVDANKWLCHVCQFANATDKTTCTLCETAHDVVLSIGASTNMAVAVLAHPLDSKQQSARARKQWSRVLQPSDGAVLWTSALELQPSDVYYMLQPSTRPVAPPSPSPKDDVKESDDVKDGDDVKDNDDVKDAENAEDEASPPVLLEMTYLTPESAARTVLGTVLPSWWLTQLESLRLQSFSVKYIWLLEQIAASYTEKVKVKVYRDKILTESLDILLALPTDKLCSFTRVSLFGETGVDAGGLQREWYTLLTHALFEPSTGLFIAANEAERSFGINPHSARDHGATHLARFEAFGRLLARAILDGQVLQCHLCVPLFKALLGTPLSMDDVMHWDATVYASMCYIRDARSVDDLALDFTVHGADDTIVELVPFGAQIAVTNENRTEYLEAMTKYLLFDRIQAQVSALLHGFYTVLPEELLLPFDYKELELLLCGTSAIDVDDWRHFTAVSFSLAITNCNDWFWAIVKDDMTDDDRARLLQFATGSSRVPLQGFKGLTSYDGMLCPFSLQAIEYKYGALPRAHSCFNRIDLPLYPTRALLKEALFAIVRLEMTEFTLV
ncbi:hypothetical protein SDRG_14819 [Saprolegnia diclina VS20]|uniref:HECT-type E3 ubiquitin transferase n=1 Tax=Saprolegnia diclina (strain VS20) TaxID=1156394 RepID=T0RCS4_SAPDV|nr:hypothetical protein SDRG_14819 [Saprolegnia diclina VS20]EQC27377.1 hypothetical protein SDRG_14819 [Saprolegnia diclina VS20]|eukprot:XP_008619196.1 hypothetical protein SDRG_14819 [Saprolegnia diclina VS20]